MVRFSNYRLPLFWAGALIAAGVWLFALQALVQTEQLAAETQLRQARAVALSFAKERFLAKWAAPESLTPSTWRDLRPFEDERTLPPALFQDLQRQLREEKLSPEALLRAIVDQRLVTEGRDQLAALALALWKKHPDHQALRAEIERRATNETIPLRPAFRHYLLTAINSAHPTRARLKLLLEGQQPFESLIHGERELLFTQGDLSQLTGPPFLSMFTPDPVPDSQRIEGLTALPYLHLVATPTQKPPFFSIRTLIFLSGLLLLTISLSALILSLRESRVANLKTEYAAAMAHELRTPLAGQRLVLESLLQRPDDLSEKARQYLEMAFTGNERLSQLAERFLTFSRLSRRHRPMLERSEIDPASFQATLTEQAQAIIDTTHRLKVTCATPLAPFTADSSLLLTAVLNLIENAKKYSPKGTIIEVSLTQTPAETVIAVQDQGCGIPKRLQSKVFRRFYRGNDHLSAQQGGLGLGLSIVQAIAKAHRGALTLESALDQGSTFTLTLPRA